MNLGYKEMYQSWLDNPYFDEDTKAELKSIAGDDKEIEDRFYTELEFGTAGLRGVIGAGMNRMNIYTVRKATQGLANYIKKVGKEAQGVAIAFDSRRMSPEFADEAALLPCRKWNQMAMYLNLKTDPGTFICSQKTRMYRRNQYYGKPQSAGV